MSALGQDMARAVRVEWTAARIAAGEAGLRQRRQRRTRNRIAAVGALAVAMAAWVLWPRDARDVESPRVVVASRPVTPSSVGDVVKQASAGQPAVPRIEHMALGKRTFETTTPLHVVAGATTIEAFSAKFAAARYEHNVRVEVMAGTVTVVWANTSRTLMAGETAVFPPDKSKSISKSRATEAPVRAVADETWRELARAGDFDRAYTALAAAERGSVAPVRDVPDELLLAADVKRLSHHGAEAVAPLEQIVREHGDDSRAPLAAFTLGRVLLELDRPADAADAFARADALAPNGPLAEDAVAREVEAHARAGHRDRAHAIAEQYVTRFPDGRKLHSVKKLGGL